MMRPIFWAICLMSSGVINAAVSQRIFNEPVIITESHQAVFYENNDGEYVHKWNESGLARNEGFATLIKYKASSFQVRVTEHIEMAGPSNWDLQHYQECEIKGNGIEITCTSLKSNDGIFYSNWLLVEDDPTGPIKVTVTIEDGSPQVFNFKLEDRLNLFAK